MSCVRQRFLATGSKRSIRSDPSARSFTSADFSLEPTPVSLASDDTERYPTMQVFEALKQAIRICASILKLGAGIQEPVRKKLAEDLQGICSRCEAAYDAVLSRLVPVKNAYSDPATLAKELRDFAADASTRAAFKPVHLCGQVDDLLLRLNSNLDAMKYSIDCQRIRDVQSYLMQFGDYDGALFRSYDNLTAGLDQIATQLQSPASDKRERSAYAQHIIRVFEDDLRATQASVHEAKNQMLAII
jgi:hypothetical protein